MTSPAADPGRSPERQPKNQPKNQPKRPARRRAEPAARSGADVVRLRGPHDVVSAVPYLVGFTPRRSLVLVSLRGPRRRWGLTARVDLPDDGSDACVGPVVERLVAYVRTDCPREVVALVYDDLSWPAAQSAWQGLVTAIGRSVVAGDVGLKEAVYVGPERFWSFTCRDHRCCPPQGSPLASTVSTPAAAAFVADGRAPVPARADLERRLAPRGPLTLAAVRSMADAEAAALLEHWARGDMAAQEGWVDEVTALLADVAARYQHAGPRLTAQEAARLLTGLSSIPVRDTFLLGGTRWLDALPSSPGDDPGARQAQGSRSRANGSTRAFDDAVERMLVDLVRYADDALGAPPLTLLGLCCWSRGDGGMANIAIERALQRDPTYRLALLADQVLQAGIAPGWVHEHRKEDARDGNHLDR
jgi:hypothetical protein